MCSRFLSLCLLCLFVAGCAEHKLAPVAAVPQIARPAGVFRVCADPNNLPFSNERGEGFENKIAELMAGTLSVDGDSPANDILNTFKSS